MFTCGMCSKGLHTQPYISPEGSGNHYHRSCLIEYLAQATQSIAQQHLPKSGACGICNQTTPRAVFVQLPDSRISFHRTCLRKILTDSLLADSSTTQVPHSTTTLGALFTEAKTPSLHQDAVQNLCKKITRVSISQGANTTPSWNGKERTWIDDYPPHVRHRDYVVYHGMDQKIPYWRSHTVQWQDSLDASKTHLRETVFSYNKDQKEIPQWVRYTVTFRDKKDLYTSYKTEFVYTYSNGQQTLYWSSDTTIYTDPDHLSNTKSVSKVCIYPQ